jgi:hypothetical protein
MTINESICPTPITKNKNMQGIRKIVKRSYFNVSTGMPNETPCCFSLNI